MTARVRSAVTTGASVERVVEVLTSDDFVARRAARFRDGATVVRREERPDGGQLLVVSRELPQGAPGFLAKLLPKDGRVLQTEEWAAGDGSARTGTWKVEIAGAPARLGGTLRVESVDGQTRYLREGEAKVSVPLVGGKAETFIADVLGRLAQRENALLLELLAP